MAWTFGVPGILPQPLVVQYSKCRKKSLNSVKHRKISNHPLMYFKITECPLVPIWNNHISRNLLAKLRFQNKVRISVINCAFALYNSMTLQHLLWHKCCNFTHSQASIFINWIHWKFFKRDLLSLCCHAWSMRMCNLRRHVIVSTLTCSLWIWTTWIKGIFSKKKQRLDIDHNMQYMQMRQIKSTYIIYVSVLMYSIL
jgi:hypothetical protein